jgi:hypothetical protein
MQNIIILNIFLKALGVINISIFRNNAMSAEILINLTIPSKDTKSGDSRKITELEIIFRKNEDIKKSMSKKDQDLSSLILL